LVSLFKPGKEVAGNQVNTDKISEKTEKIISGLEGHVRQLCIMRQKLERRRQVLFNSALMAIERRDNLQAGVLTSEHEEIKKAIRAVEVGELALVQITIRLETIRDIGDVMSHLNSALNFVAATSGDMSDLMPDIEVTVKIINEAIGRTLSELGSVGIDFRLDLSTPSSQELIDEAKRFANEKMRNFVEDFGQLESADTMAKPAFKQREQEERIVVLATGDEQREDITEELISSQFKPFLFSSRESASLIARGMVTTHSSAKSSEEHLCDWVNSARGKVDIAEMSSRLGISSDEVEQMIFSLARKGKLARASNSE
jgi:division protein CdvB (Snf7/Vps24/ESCRT-III family)